MCPPPREGRLGADDQAAGLACDDNELLSRMQAGSVEAFGQLYDRYCERAYRVARSVSLSAASAEDAVQEAFVAIWNARDTYRPDRASAAPWLTTIVRFRAIDISRREVRHKARETGHQVSEDIPSIQDVALEAATRIEGGRVRRLIARLPDSQQEVVVLAFFGELTQTEIAEQTGIPLGTVKSRMRLGLGRLHGELEDRGAR